MSGSIVVLVALAAVGLAIWAVYYFIFSGRATTRLVERLMSEPCGGQQLQSDYRAVVTADGIACEHPHRPREFVRWAEVREISIRTTSGGPWRPDLWLLFVGDTGGCSVPTGAAGFDAVFESLRRFHGFDFGCFLKGGTDDAMDICWRRNRSSD
jgi:hypothetical protein